MHYRQQYDETDCGAACLAMIASHFGKSLSIAEVRRQAGTDQIGTNLLGLVEAAKKYGLKAEAVKGTADALNKKTSVPFIAHLHIKDEEKDTDVTHFVVIKKIAKKHITVWDPDPEKKKRTIPLADFLKDWTGYAVFFEPDFTFVSDKDSNKKTGGRLFKFLPVFVPYKKLILFSLLASLILIFFGIVSSFYYKYLFDEVIYAKASFTLVTLSVGMLVVIVTQSVIETIRSVLLSHFSFKTDLTLNFSYLSHIFKLPISFFESRKSGEILSRLSDLDTVKNTLSNTVMSGLLDVIMLLVIGPVLFSVNSALFGISLCTVLVVSVIVFFFSKVYKRYYSEVMSQNADVQSYLYESINGVATVKALNAEQKVFETYEQKKMKAVDTSWHLNRFSISQNLLTGLVSGISSILVYWIGCRFIINDTLTLGTLISFNTLSGYFTGPLFRLVNMQSGLQEALVASERVGEILELEKEQDDASCLLMPEKIQGQIDIQDITFRYGTRKNIYEHLSMTINKGEWTAVVGPSGCGKTTLTKLLLKFYEVQEGRIFIDGTDIRDIDAATLRSKVGYVPQDVFLFSGTVAENIAMHQSDATIDEIILAAKKAGAHEFIEKLPKRYDTILGEHGGGLSGGEKQRLALARCLLGSPAFIILDEATSNLDTVSEQSIHKVIESLRDEHITVILIAHRLSTVKNCDTIFVMQDGRIVEKGTHTELLKAGGLYSEMWQGASL